MLYQKMLINVKFGVDQSNKSGKDLALALVTGLDMELMKYHIGTIQT